jgi:hypothetical protein
MNVLQRKGLGTEVFLANYKPLKVKTFLGTSENAVQTQI